MATNQQFPASIRIAAEVTLRMWEAQGCRYVYKAETGVVVPVKAKRFICAQIGGKSARDMLMQSMMDGHTYPY